jgi:uncharacterized membrane protein YoaK (UPF0700 family)
MIRRLSNKPQGLHLGLMLALTFSTGMIDAVGYLGLDRVFTGNMTGNVVILGMALTGADNLPVLGPILAMAAFMVGAVIAGRVLRPIEVGWSGHTTVLITIVGSIIVGAAVTSTVIAVMAEPIKLAVTAALGLAMGIQAGAARHIAVKDVTTVVITSTMVGLAYDSRFGGNLGQPWLRRVGAIALIGLGAAFGALLLQITIGLGMLAAAVITLLVAVLGHLARYTRAPRESPTTTETVTTEPVPS